MGVNIYNCVLYTLYFTCFAFVNSELINLKDSVDQSISQVLSHAGVEKAKSDVIKNVLVLQQKTNIFVGAKLKQNLFKALRVLAEKELQSYSNEGKPSPLIRQEEEGEEDDDSTDDTTTKTTVSSTTISGSTTTVKSTNFVPVVATFVKAIFGGNNAVNLTSYVQGATRFLPQAVGKQILGVVRLISHNPRAKTTTTTTTTTTTSTTIAPTTTLKPTSKPRRRRRTTSSPTTITTISQTDPESISTQFQVESETTDLATTLGFETTINALKDETSTFSKATENVNSQNSTSTSKTTEEEEEDDEEAEAPFSQVSPFARQLKLPDINDGLNFLGTLVLGVTPKSSGGRRRTNATTTESPSGFEDEPEKKEGLDLTGLATGIRMGLGDLVKVVPDLFKGAREAVGLLSGIQSLLSGFNIGA